MLQCAQVHSLLSLLVLLSLPRDSRQTSELENSTCPTWFVPTETESGSYSCKCGDSLNGIVYCDDCSEEVALLVDFCMSYDPALNQTVVGPCIYTRTNITVGGYIPLPDNASQLNHAICGAFNRDGLLCGKCADGYSPGLATFIYDHKCVKCKPENAANGWAIFFTVQLLPVTVLFLIVVIFQISATIPAMNAFVFICQYITLPEYIGFITSSVNLIDSRAAKFEYVVLSVYGIWNLDLFRPLIPNLCLNDQISTLEALALEYTAAGFLIFLTVVTYAGIELHARGYRVILWLWRPFHRCFTQFKRSWNLKRSIIDAFATFILLSYNKVLLVSVRLLHRAKLYGPSGESVGHTYFLYDATVEFLGKEHLPFAILSIIILITVVAIPPLLLTFYQLRIFQRGLSLCRINFPGLHIFVDQFQGCYKDSSHGGCDFRFFAGLYFILRIVFAATITSLYSTWAYIAVILTICVSASFALLRPYKRSIYNKLDSIFFAFLAIAFFMKIFAQKMEYVRRDLGEQRGLIGFICFLALLPLAYITVICIYWLLFRFRHLKTCFRHCFKFTGVPMGSMEFDQASTASASSPLVQELSSSLPDRIINPNVYQSMESSAAGIHLVGGMEVMSSDNND